MGRGRELPKTPTSGLNGSATLDSRFRKWADASAISARQLAIARFKSCKAPGYGKKIAFQWPLYLSYT